MRIPVEERGDGIFSKASPNSRPFFYSVSVEGNSLMRRTKRVYTSATETSDCINPCNCCVAEYLWDITGYTIVWVGK